MPSRTPREWLGFYNDKCCDGVEPDFIYLDPKKIGDFAEAVREEARRELVKPAVKCVKNMYASGFIRGHRNALLIVRGQQLKEQAEFALVAALEAIAKLAGMTTEGFAIGDDHPGFAAEPDDEHVICLCERCRK